MTGGQPELFYFRMFKGSMKKVLAKEQKLFASEKPQKCGFP